MSKLLTFSILLSTLLLGTLAWSQDLGRGWDAYNKGDYATALREWKPLAEQGDTAAQFNLGWMYGEGLGVPEDVQQAVKWYRRSADQGDAAAQYTLGLIYNQGRGVPQDFKQAVEWYRRSAEQGHAMAMGNLAVLYENGDGVLQDDVLAYMWGNLGAAEGDFIGEVARGLVSKRMTPSQLEEAQRRSRECLRKNYKGC